MPPQSTENRLMVSVPEVARRCGVGKGTAWRLINDGQLPHVRIGRRVLVRVADLDEFVSNLGAA